VFTKVIKFSLVLFSTLTFLFSLTSNAARVTQSKNNKVMIDLEGAEATPQQDIVLINKQNKRVALGKILQVKGGKAVATITKGKATGDETVQLGGGGGATAQSSPVERKGKPVGRAGAKKVSVVLNMLNNAMTTLQSDGTLPTPNTETVPMKGTSFGVTGILDWPVFQKLTLRGTFGYEPFNTTGTAKFNSCDNLSSTNCNANITYLSGGGYARYDFMQSQFLLWGALGGTVKFPMAKSTTALRSDDIKMTMTYGFALGVDYFIDNKYFIPASVEQQFFLKSDTVDANILMVRVGFGMAL
jgi:hypothetical protein